MLQQTLSSQSSAHVDGAAAPPSSQQLTHSRDVTSPKPETFSGKDIEEHRRHVHQVLQRLLENRLFVKAKKCEFHQPSITFLGYILECGQVRSDPEKIKVVLEWPVPESRKTLQHFLGFANFYRWFIKDYGLIAAPLTALTSSKVTFSWSSEAEAVFQDLKKKFSQAPILVHPDPSKQFIMEVDASDTGVGAVFSQNSESGSLQPCAFFFRQVQQHREKL
ncbi:uncharacterized mitochondrial protein AtMg00860-like isoform X1 [Girardinichthys multiradiatus]|uniref:uncharacterized mitochondrial protein AtMg00860-like isoform X1 n=1 Tax=Girardinichthys multiradiatus TaxID=208333 RepID=UPI001FAD0234|nr:uncharacterized mitochondrial protein AtMg00860-like isoform X1 [Girardinichthys multiradiatus]